jgi:hypothetical protein
MAAAGSFLSSANCAGMLGSHSPCTCVSLVNYGLSFVLSGSLISRIGMSCVACPRLLLLSGEHTVQLRNTVFEKLFEVLGFLS